MFYTRLLKEVSAYEKEVDTAEKKLESMRSQGKDEFDLKQQVSSIHPSLELRWKPPTPDRPSLCGPC